MRSTALAVSLSVLTLALPTRAIEPAPAPAPPPTAPAPAPPPLEPPPGAYGPGAGSPTTAPPEMTGPEEEDEDDGGEGRFRGGVGGLFGAFFPGGVWQFGPEGRLGYQIDDLMAVYASFGTHAGFRIDDGSFHAGAAVFASPMFEVTLADIFFVGLGPQFLYGTFGSVDTVTTGESVGAEVGVFSGLMPGFKLKTGLGFGSDAPDRRKQFTMALDLSVVFGDRYQVTTAGSADVGVAVGVLPMLALGYDAK